MNMTEMVSKIEGELKEKGIIEPFEKIVLQNQKLIVAHFKRLSFQEYFDRQKVINKVFDYELGDYMKEIDLVYTMMY